MRLVLQTANVVSDAKNCLYPNRVEARDAAELQEAIKKDHVCGEYKKNYRSKENFIRSNVGGGHGLRQRSLRGSGRMDHAGED